MKDRYKHVLKWIVEAATDNNWTGQEINGNELFSVYQKGGGRLGRRAFGCALLDIGLQRRQSNNVVYYLIDGDELAQQ